MQTQTLQISSQSIAMHKSSGTGPAVLFVHGNSASGRAFQRQLDSPLGEKFRLVAIDLPGHGQSEKAPNPQATYTLPGYANIVSEVVDKLGLYEAVFVGWSLGGHVVLEAADQLAKASGFVIHGTPPLGFPPAMERAFFPHPAMAAAFKADLSQDEMDAFITASLKPGVSDLPDSFKSDMRQADGQARAIIGGSLTPGGYKDEVEAVANLSTPLAILHGEQEQLVNGDYFSDLTIPTLWRDAVQIISAAGHTPQWEQAEQFNALLEAFVNEVVL